MLSVEVFFLGLFSLRKKSRCHMTYLKNFLDFGQTFKNTCFEAPSGVKIGGSEVSIGGFGSLRVSHVFSLEEPEEIPCPNTCCQLTLVIGCIFEMKSYPVIGIIPCEGLDAFFFCDVFTDWDPMGFIIHFSTTILEHKMFFCLFQASNSRKSKGAVEKYKRLFGPWILMSQGSFVKDKKSRKTKENQRMDGRTCRPCSAHVGRPKQGDVVVA